MLTLVAGLVSGAAGETTSTTVAPTADEETTTTTEATTTTTEATTTTTEATTTTSEATTTTTTEATTSTTEATTSTSEATTTTTEATTTTADEADRGRIDEAESSKARELNAATARLDELSDALAELERDLDTQSAEVDIATRELVEAQAFVQATQDEVLELEQQVAELKVSLGDQAIRSFKGDSIDEAVLVGTDPTRTMRRQTLLAKATQSDIDFANELASVRESLNARKLDAEDAVLRAERFRSASEGQLEELETDREAYGDLALAAEDRIDHLLAERAALAQLGADVDAGLDIDIDEELVARLAAAAPASSGSGSQPTTVADGEIVLAANGIMVHESIVEDVRRLLADAAAAGVVLAGGGFRDPAQQIAVRKNNCGTSQYAIYEKPSSQCSPPTARPGRSMHEQGRAIDFTYNGKIISSRSGPAWNWLANNASKYGLYNLPSEPWHWSTNGR